METGRTTRKSCGTSWKASPPRRVPSAARGLAALLILAALVSCTGGPKPAAAPEHGIPPWQIPAEDLGRQRLYRVSYHGPEGDGSFRMTLRLATVERYQVQAVDPVGRALWSLDVSGERGLFLNHRARTSCVFAGSFDLSGIPLGPFPLLTLPALLLGRVPAVPAASAPEAGPREKEGELTFADAAGRSWAVTLAPGGAVASWTLLEDGVPAVWWLRRDSSAILSDRARGVQLRWREVLSEPLEKELAALDAPGTPGAPGAPEGYREEPCRETADPAGSGSSPGAI